MYSIYLFTFSVVNEWKCPYSVFAEWMNLAKESYDEPNAMTIATVNEEGFPSARMVLLKEVKHNQGFVFFTNYGSRKAAEIENNPNVALVFYWDKLKRSVRVEGKAERISAHESQDYFFSRSKASQIGSAVSPQSQLVQRYCFRTLLTVFYTFIFDLVVIGFGTEMTI